MVDGTGISRLFLILGALSAFLGVAAGALGTHALRASLAPELLATFETGVRYQIYHALGLLAVAVVAGQWPGPLPGLAGWLFVAGTILFSGSLYVLSVTGARWLGAITPFGGFAFLAGWLLLAWAAWQSRG